MGLRLWRIPQDLRIIRRGGGEGGALDRPDVNPSFSDDDDDDTVRIGILGASNIAKFAVLWPALKDTAAENVVVHAVASRDGAKARKYADSAGIPNAYEGYQKVLEDPKVDAVYIGLPSELHFMWAKRAILAGKHVLVEKPLTLNYHEAEVLRDLIASQERYNHQNQEEGKEETSLDRTKNKKTKKKKKQIIVLEGYHYRFHPVARHVKRVVQDSKFMGNIISITFNFSLVDPKAAAKMTFYSLPPPSSSSSTKDKIKLLDRWCYAVDTIRFVLPKETTYRVETAEFTSPYHLSARLEATTPLMKEEEDVVVVHFTVEKARVETPSWNLEIKGSKHTVSAINIGHPYLYHKIQVNPTADDVVKNNKHQRSKTLQVYGKGETTFEHQLAAFVASIRHNQQRGVAGREADDVRAVAGDDEIWPGIDNALENMKLIDQILRKGNQKTLESIQME